MNITDRVKAGIEFITGETGQSLGLDLNRVDLDQISLNSSRLCVLAQAIPSHDFWEAYDKIGQILGFENRASEMDTWVRNHGFEVNPGTGTNFDEILANQTNERFDLEMEWKAQIREIRALATN